MNSWTLPEAEPFKLSLKMCKAIYVTQKGGKFILSLAAELFGKPKGSPTA